VNHLPDNGVTSLTPLITATCQADLPGAPSSSVQTHTVTLAGQTWTRGNCGASAQSGSELVVEMLVYRGQVYTLEYVSPTATFPADQSAYYTPMEASFQFLS
jgi:hypothetical protein